MGEGGTTLFGYVVATLMRFDPLLFQMAMITTTEIPIT